MSRITAVFDSQMEAEAAINELRRMGVSDSHLSVVSRHEGDLTSGSVGSLGTSGAEMTTGMGGTTGSYTGVGSDIDPNAQRVVIEPDTGTTSATSLGSGTVGAGTLGTSSMDGGVSTPTNLGQSGILGSSIGDGRGHTDGAFDTTSGEVRERPRDAADGAVKGLAAGAGVGALFGLLAAAIPGVGPFVTAGVLASTLGAAGGAAVGGALVGGAAGSLAGTLAQLGYTDNEAGYYGQRVEQGGILVAVETGSTIADSSVIDVLQRHGGHIHAA